MGENVPGVRRMPICTPRLTMRGGLEKVGHHDRAVDRASADGNAGHISTLTIAFLAQTTHPMEQAPHALHAVQYLKIPCIKLVEAPPCGTTQNKHKALGRA